jgi:hypothetical protein
MRHHISRFHILIKIKEVGYFTENRCGNWWKYKNTKNRCVQFKSIERPKIGVRLLKGIETPKIGVVIKKNRNTEICQTCLIHSTFTIRGSVIKESRL